jgi:ankyrin repeat protein
VSNNARFAHAQNATPLIVAAHAGHIEIVKLLLSKGADPLAKDNAGNTALDHARHKSFVAIVTELELAVEVATKAVRAAVCVCDECVSGDGL